VRELRATYRLQLRPDFGFDAAAAVVPYLADLGATHVYCSPYLQAAPGSTHGYDVVDHSKVNDELGGAEAHGRFLAALAEHGLGQVLDIVPNHMAVTPENAWWTDVLENGPASRYAAYFDVDWDPPERKLRNTILLPVLGDHYGRVLEDGEVALERDGGTFRIRYFDHCFPVDPRSYDVVLGSVGDEETSFLAGAFSSLDPNVAKRHLARLCEERPDVAARIDEAVATINAEPDLLDALLERQNYRLAYWRTAGQELDYRRFFDINTLAGLRMEDGQVFQDTHGLVLQWVQEGVLDGIRVDHPDGLRDPQWYFDRLRACAPDGWIVVEKILEPGESLPESWPVDGTTGYDFLNRLGGVFVDTSAEAALTEAYGAYTGAPTSYEDVVHEAQHLVLDRVLAADVRRLTHLFVQVCETHRRYRDFTRPELHAVLQEAIACFPVYRTYVRPGTPVAPQDEQTIAGALNEAQKRRGDLDPELFELLGRVLRGQLTGPAAELCLRFQQTTGPVMAKGVEDTTFYRYNRLVALNEVGGDPGHFGMSVERFHADLQVAAERWPRAMLASSTHDTKRSEDVRARIALLSEIPGDFAAAVERWSAMHEPPDRNLAWLVFQTLIGAHPLPLDRLAANVEKATKEAKQHTSWTDPDPAYDDAVRGWLEALLGDAAFAADLDAFVAPLLDAGWTNSLAAQLVKLTAPGVPDVYQGTELWDLSLVDPDNRRPVDYEARRRLLAELDGLTPAELWTRRSEGLPKLWLTREALRARPSGGYRPLPVRGAAADHVVAFTRDDRVSTVVPRLPLTLARNGGWRDTSVELPGRGEVAVAELLADLPAALVVA
jgi:(1->4)-alpha-D-glucan 1-alpha-D-glucosylmutase